MRQYHSDNKNYNAILDAMAQIRQNQLNESYGYYAEEDDEEQMQEMSDEEEMTEAEHEEMEEQMSDDEAEMVAEMLDEALAEIYEEDDEDNHQIDEADGGERRKRRRNNLLKAAAIGAGLVALGGAGAAGMGLLPGQFGQQAVQGALKTAGTAARGLYGRGKRAMNPNPTGGNRTSYGMPGAGRGVMLPGAGNEFDTGGPTGIKQGAIDDFGMGYKEPGTGSLSAAERSNRINRNIAINRLNRRLQN
jgi:hypothetical protein